MVLREDVCPTNAGGAAFHIDAGQFRVGTGANAITNYNNITNWTSIACSADGTRLIAVASGGAIYTSSNSGLTWTKDAAPSLAWTGVGCSADGCKRVAVARGGGIYTWQSVPRPALNLLQKANTLLVSWIIPSANFLLHSNSDLGSTNWAGVTQQPVLNLSNLHNEVSSPLSAAPIFYRLKAN